MDGKKSKAAGRQTQYRRTMRETGKHPVNIWIDTDSKNQFVRIKELLECNSNDAFDAVMRMISNISDGDLLDKLKGD